MEHLAILTQGQGLLDLIARGTKNIESRWSKKPIRPYEDVEAGERIYFKEGRRVQLVADIRSVQYFEHLTPNQLQKIMEIYAPRIGLPAEQLVGAYSNRPYGTLVFLDNPRPIVAFEIDKNGFGSGTAWLTVESVEKLKRIPAPLPEPGQPNLF